MKTDKRAGLQLSLNTVTGLVLAVMAIIAIVVLIAGMIGSIMTDKEKDQGIEAGFNVVFETIKNVHNTALTSPQYVDVMLDDNYVLLGFNKDQKVLAGECGKPTLPRTIKMSITRDPIKCPLNRPCLCLCQADGISLIPWLKSMHDYVNCQTGICSPFSEKDGSLSFANAAGCEMPMVFSDAVTNIKISMQGTAVTMQKE